MIDAYSRLQCQQQFDYFLSALRNFHIQLLPKHIVQVGFTGIAFNFLTAFDASNLAIIPRIKTFLKRALVGVLFTNVAIKKIYKFLR